MCPPWGSFIRGSLGDGGLGGPLARPEVLFALGRRGGLVGLNGLYLGAGQLFSRDSIAVYEHTLKVTRRNPLIQNNLGLALAAQGKVWIRLRSSMTRPCVLIPVWPWPITTWGWPWPHRAKMDQAAAQYAEALRLKSLSGPGP